MTLAAGPNATLRVGGGGWWAQAVALGERTGVALALAGLLAVDIALGLGYATATPIWQNPDEPAHYNYVAYVAQTGGLPELRLGDWDSALLERLKTGQLSPTDPAISTIRYEAWQPPLYYVLAAQLFRLGPPDDALAEVHRLRVFGVLLGGLTLLLGYLAGRQLFLAERPAARGFGRPPDAGASRQQSDAGGAGQRPDARGLARTAHGRWLALGVPLAMAGVPMFSSVSSAVSADPLANLLAAGLVVLLLRGLRADPAGARRVSSATQPQPRRPTEAQPPVLARTRASGLGWCLGTGLVLGLGLLTKLALGVFVPLALGVAVWRARRPLRDAATLLVAPALLSAPWLVHQVTSYGWLDPLATARHAQVVQDQQRFPGLSPEYLGAFGTTTFHSFWAQFGWMAIPAPDRLYWVWGAICLVGLVGVLMRPWDSRWWLMGGVVLLGLLAYVGYNLAYLQLQGRYLFIALVPLCALLVRGWAAWSPGRARPVLPLGVGAVLIGLNVYALVRVLEPGFGP